MNEARETATGDIVPITTITQEQPQESPIVLLEEQNRPGELMPAFEDEHGTYIMNSKDLRAVQHVDSLTKLGIDSFKIEGRTKSIYYVARTTQVYHRAIADAVAGRPFNMGMMEELEGMANRGFTEGFYRRHPPGEYQNYERGVSTSDKQQFVGVILDRNDEWLTVDVRNHFEAGDQLELMTTNGNVSFELPTIIDKNDATTDVAPGSGHIVKIPIPESASPGEINEFSLLVRYLPRQQDS